MTEYKSLISTQHPSHWKVVRNKSFLSVTGEVVGKRANDFVLLSLTTNGVIVRDIDSGKGKFPKDFDTYQVVRPNELVFCLFDIDETPRTVGLVETEGMVTGAYTAFPLGAERLNLSDCFLCSLRHPVTQVDQHSCPDSILRVLYHTGPPQTIRWPFVHQL